MTLDEQHEVVVLAGTDPAPGEWGVAGSWHAARQRQDALMDPSTGHPLAAQLVVAGEQFRVARASQQRTVIAGYHWFADWGRDTMISLPALAMRPGTLWEARAVLDTYIKYLDHGLIPSRFPDGGEAPEYDTMDATLWLFQAVAAYLRASGEWRFIADRLHALGSIIAWHIGGTRHNIRMDDRDGLLAGGDEGYALTWMDARVGDWVVTPRRGKPIEINALWYNALRLTADWCERAMRPAGRYRQMALQVHESAQGRGLLSRRGHCYARGPPAGGPEPRLRPHPRITPTPPSPVVQT